MDSEVLAHYNSNDEECAGSSGQCSGQAGKASSQPAPGWLNPTPGREAEKKDEKAWPAWTITRPSASGIAHTPACRTMTSTASAMAVAQALAKAAERAAVATKRAADILHSAGERMGQQGSTQENSASDPRPSTGDTGTAAAGQRGRRGGRGGRVSCIPRSKDGQATRKAASCARMGH